MASATAARCTLTTEPLDARALAALVARPEAGAVCTFEGVVRDHNLGRAVRYLEYEAYDELALTTMTAIAEEAEARWPGSLVAFAHRVGRLEIGEASVVVAASNAHRDAAFQACRYAIDALKERVPIWKKEVWTDGSHWVEGVAPRPIEAPQPQAPQVEAPPMPASQENDR